MHHRLSRHPRSQQRIAPGDSQLELLDITAAPSGANHRRIIVAPPSSPVVYAGRPSRQGAATSAAPVLDVSSFITREGSTQSS